MATAEFSNGIDRSSIVADAVREVDGILVKRYPNLPQDARVKILQQMKHFRGTIIELLQAIDQSAEEAMAQ